MLYRMTTKNFTQKLKDAGSLLEKALALVARGEGLIDRALEVTSTLSSEEVSTVRAAMTADAAESWAAAATVVNQIAVAMRTYQRAELSACAAAAAEAELLSQRKQRASIALQKAETQARVQQEQLARTKKSTRLRSTALTKATKRLTSIEQQEVLVKTVELSTENKPPKVYGPYLYGRTWRLVTIRDGKSTQKTYKTRELAEQAKEQATERARANEGASHRREPRTHSNRGRTVRSSIRKWLS